MFENVRSQKRKKHTSTDLDFSLLSLFLSVVVLEMPPMVKNIFIGICFKLFLPQRSGVQNVTIVELMKSLCGKNLQRLVGGE